MATPKSGVPKSTLKRSVVPPAGGILPPTDLEAGRAARSPLPDL